MKRLILTLLVCVVFVSCVACASYGEQHRVNNTTHIVDGNLVTIPDYSEIEQLFIDELRNDYGIKDFELCNSSELTTDKLEKRNGYTIVERCIGMVTNETYGDGVILNQYDNGRNYISYKTISEKYHKGTMVLSYMIYNKNTNYIDDIAERFDFVISRDYEESEGKHETNKTNQR